MIHLIVGGTRPRVPLDGQSSPSMADIAHEKLCCPYQDVAKLPSGYIIRDVNHVRERRPISAACRIFLIAYNKLFNFQSLNQRGEGFSGSSFFV